MTRPPYLSVTWTDPVTGRPGYLVIDRLVAAAAAAGCGCAPAARWRRSPAWPAAMTPEGGAGLRPRRPLHPARRREGRHRLRPAGPRRAGVLRRFLAAMRPFLERYWTTGEDLGVRQDTLDEIAAEPGCAPPSRPCFSASTTRRRRGAARGRVRRRGRRHRPRRAGRRLRRRRGGAGGARAARSRAAEGTRPSSRASARWAARPRATSRAPACASSRSPTAMGSSRTRRARRRGAAARPATARRDRPLRRCGPGRPAAPGAPGSRSTRTCSSRPRCRT